MKRTPIPTLEELPEETGRLITEYEATLASRYAPETAYQARRLLIRLFARHRVSPAMLDREELEAYVMIRAEELSPRSVHKMIAAVESFYDYLIERDLAYQNPAKHLPRVAWNREKTLGVYTEEEVKRILGALPADGFLPIRDRAMMELLYSSGMRAGELVGLDIDDVDLREREILIRSGKGGKERRVPVGERALSALLAYLEKRREILPGEEALFVSLKKRRIMAGQVSDRVRQWKEKAGVTAPGCAHAFRHSMATHLLARGAPLTVIKRLLGHAWIQTTSRYTHPDASDAKKAYAGAHPRAGKKKGERYEYHGIQIRRRKGP